MNRLGTVIKFKPGTTKAQAVEALMKIRGVVDFPKESIRWPDVDGPITMDMMIREPFKLEDALHEYDDEWGHPTWYIP
jgi:hypothetical protein